jgi:pyruvate/2-oxoglutarate/acetoin dehydrogenase E1 component
VGAYGGCFAVTKGLMQEYGRERIRDCPLCESTYTGIALGAAMNGMRPICEVMTVNFSLLALDQIMNNAATLLHMTGGMLNVPVVIRMATGAGRQLAAQHATAWRAGMPISLASSSGAGNRKMHAACCASPWKTPTR